MADCMAGKDTEARVYRTEKLMKTPPFRIALVEPQIPPNTGNIARLCAATGCELVLVGKLGFDLSDSALKRAGLDYWKFVNWRHEPDTGEFFIGLPQRQFHMLTTRAHRPYTALPAAWGDWLIFGKETAGLSQPLLEQYKEQCYTIPMWAEGVRSLNLSSAVAIVLYDALRRVRQFGLADDAIQTGHEN